MRYAFPLLIGVLGCAILVGLGVWQIQRLAWKEAVLADMDARMTAEPVAVPARPTQEEHAFLPVQAAGEITGEEIHVFANTREVGTAFRVVALFVTEDGRRLMLDRGAVSDALKNIPRDSVAAEVTGNLHWPDETDAFTPDPDRAANMWFGRDVRAMSLELGTEPVLIVARETVPGADAITPLPVTTTGIPNDHLQYALTWFGLALVWGAMTLYWIGRIRKGRTA